MFSNVNDKEVGVKIISVLSAMGSNVNDKEDGFKVLFLINFCCITLCDLRQQDVFTVKN